MNKNLMVCDVKIQNATVGTCRCICECGSKVRRRTCEWSDPLRDQDWVCVGDVPGAFSILDWVQRLFSFHAGRRADEMPFFVDYDRVRPYLYHKALAEFRRILARVSSAEEAAAYGLHGLRVSGYDLTLVVGGEL